MGHGIKGNSLDTPFRPFLPYCLQARPANPPCDVGRNSSGVEKVQKRMDESHIARALLIWKTRLERSILKETLAQNLGYASAETTAITIYIYKRDITSVYSSARRLCISRGNQHRKKPTGGNRMKWGAFSLIHTHRPCTLPNIPSSLLPGHALLLRQACLKVAGVGSRPRQIWHVFSIHHFFAVMRHYAEPQAARPMDLCTTKRVASE